MVTTAPAIWRADGIAPTADSLNATADAGYDPNGPRPGWPCFGLGDTPPSVADRQSNPTVDDLLPQVLALGPRGPAWGTDEAGDGRGASPLMRRFWSALAAWSAQNNARDFELATQTFPSAITYALPDWEAELGLPDPCFKGGAGTASRINAVRARFGALGGQSLAYFICLAAAVGYAITIEEPTQFMVDVSAVVGDSLVEGWFRIDEGVLDDTPIETFTLLAGEVADEVADDSIVDEFFRIDVGVLDDTSIEGPVPAAILDGPAFDRDTWKHWIVRVASLGETWFRIDEGAIDTDPLEGFYTAADLECLLRRYCPPHTLLTFAYDLA